MGEAGRTHGGASAPVDGARPEEADVEPLEGSGRREGLSVVLAVKNEASEISEALKLLEFADETIVVDMGSTDETVERSRQFTDKVYVHDGGPHGLIHVNKNFGFDRATQPWILNLDADARLTPDLRDEILAILRKPDPGVVAYGLPCTHFFFGK